MNLNNGTRKTIQELDKERLEIIERSKKNVPWLIAIPVIVFLGGFLFITNPIVTIISTVLSIIISGITYSTSVQSPFKKLHQELRGVLLDEFMKNHHPETEFSYYPTKQSSKEIIRSSGLISADFYNEEDVIIGHTKQASFYLSEIKLENETGSRKNKTRNRTTIFNGLLFRIKIKGKKFPDAQIESQHGFLKKLFSSFIENKEFGFWYDTQNFKAFDEELKPLFPFIKYLIEKQGDVRIRTFKDEIILMIESDMKFLDEPNPKLGDSFLNKIYYETMGKQLNSLLFIIESFVNDLSTKEIEDRLELKALELVNQELQR